MFLYHPVTRELLFSETEYEVAVYKVPEPPVPFDRLVRVLDLSLFKDFLHEVLHFKDELTLPVVLHLRVREVQEEWNFPFLRPGIN